MVGTRGHGDRVLMEGGHLLPDDSPRDLAQVVREERGKRALHQAVDRGVGGVLGGLLVEMSHEGHDVGGEGASGLGDEEVDLCVCVLFTSSGGSGVPSSESCSKANQAKAKAGF